MKIRFSPLLAGASGKAADAVAATWKGRAYIRKHVIPANPKSPAQTAVRESLARCVTLWRSLGILIKAWLDTYGTGYAMSGYNVFVKKNRANEAVPQALVPVPPNPNVPPLADLEGSVVVAETITASWTDLALPGFTNVALILRDQAGNVFSAELLDTLGSAEMYDFTGLTTGHIYDLYGWVYNPTTGAMGTVAEVMDLTVT
ncbi:hypothetical protein ES705_29170 [subsurface metagenome]